MKKLIYPLLALLLICSAAIISISTQEYKVKEGFEIKFDSKDPSGVFEKMDAKINFDKNDLANSSFEISIDVSSINTGNKIKDLKALTSEWFNSSKYPNIEFVSTSIVKDDGDYKVLGKLKIKGVTGSRKIPMKVSESKGGLRFSGSFWVDRLYYEVGEPSKTVPSKMKITYNIPVEKK